MLEPVAMQWPYGSEPTKDTPCKPMSIGGHSPVGDPYRSAPKPRPYGPTLSLAAYFSVALALPLDFRSAYPMLRRELPVGNNRYASASPLPLPQNQQPNGFCSTQRGPFVTAHFIKLLDFINSQPQRNYHALIFASPGRTACLALALPGPPTPLILQPMLQPYFRVVVFHDVNVIHKSRRVKQ